MKIESGLEEKSKDLAISHSGTVFELIGGQFIEIGRKKLVASFLLNDASRQVFGLLHGGIYAYVSESLASLGGWLGLDLEKELCVGIEINANHLKSVSQPGEIITATATPFHQGKTIQVWQVQFHDSRGEMVSISRCTLLIRAKLSKDARQE